MKNILVFVSCIIGLLIIETSCSKGDKSNAAKIVIGDVRNLETDSNNVVFLVSKDSNVEEMSQKDLEGKKFKVGDVVKVGVALYEGSKKISLTKENNISCPYVTQTLNSGDNVYNLSVCVEKECTILSQVKSNDSFYASAIDQLGCSGKEYTELSCYYNNQYKVYLSCKIDKKEGAMLPNASYSSGTISFGSSSVKAVYIGPETTL